MLLSIHTMTVTGEDEATGGEQLEMATASEYWRIKVEDYPTLNHKYGRRRNSCSWYLALSATRGADVYVTAAHRAGSGGGAAHVWLYCLLELLLTVLAF